MVSFFICKNNINNGGVVKLITFYVISKTFTLLLNPATWVIILLLIVYFKRKKVFLFAALSVFHVFTNGPLSDKVIVSTTKNYNNAHFNRFRKYKVAVVMGGFSDVDTVNNTLSYMESSGRLIEAIRLYNKGHVEKILISGDKCIIKPKLFYNYMRELGIPDSVFILEKKARNIRENAIYTVSWLKSKFKGNEVLLITSAIHMKRSLACFACEGFYPHYYSVETHQGTIITGRSFYPNWKTMDTLQSVFNEWIGIGVYKMMGYC